MSLIENFPDVSAEYWFEVDGGVPMLHIALSHVPDSKAVDVPDLEQISFHPEVSFLLTPSLVFEEHEALRQWIRERPSTPFIVRAEAGPDSRDHNPQRLSVVLKMGRPSGEAVLCASPRAGFGAGFEQAFQDERQIWKAAATPDCEEVWVARFGRTGDAPIALSAGSESSIFAPPPISPRTWSQTNVPIHDYRPGAGIDFNAPPSHTRTFADIDLDVWMMNLLRDVRSIAGSGDGALRVAGLCSRIEESLADRIAAITERQPQTDPTAARLGLKSAMRSDIEAYGAGAIVSIPISAVVDTNLGWMQLMGNVGPVPAGVTLSSGTIKVQPESEVVFVVSSSAPQSAIPLHVRFDATSLDVGGSEPSTFVVPDDPVLRVALGGPFTVPVVARSAPARPALLVQEGLLSVPEPKTIDDAMSWQYRCQITHEQSLHDTTVFDLGFNGRSRDAAAPASEEALFRALAQHVGSFDAIRTAWPDEHAVRGLGDVLERVLTTLEATPDNPSCEPRGAFSFTMRTEDADGMVRVHLTSPFEGCIPVVQVMGWSTEETETPGVYRFRNHSGARLTTEEALTIPLREVHVPLSLFSHQSVSVSVRVVRNGALDSGASVQPFIRHSDAVFFETLSPSLDISTPIHIGGARRPLAQHLSPALGRLFSNAATTTQPFRLECRYADLSELPVFRIEEEIKGEDPTPIVDVISSTMDQWLDAFPVSDNGKLLFDVTLLRGTSAVTTPLIRMRLFVGIDEIER